MLPAPPSFSKLRNYPSWISWNTLGPISDQWGCWPHPPNFCLHLWPPLNSNFTPWFYYFNLLLKIKLSWDFDIELFLYFLTKKSLFLTFTRECFNSIKLLNNHSRYAGLDSKNILISFGISKGHTRQAIFKMRFNFRKHQIFTK